MNTVDFFSVCHLILLKGYESLDLGHTLIQYDFILIISAKDPISNVLDEHEFLEDTDPLYCSFVHAKYSILGAAILGCYSAKSREWLPECHFQACGHGHVAQLLCASASSCEK